jgi:hypothetical protein
MSDTDPRGGEYHKLFAQWALNAGEEFPAPPFPIDGVIVLAKADEQLGDRAGTGLYVVVGERPSLLVVVVVFEPSAPPVGEDGAESDSVDDGDAGDLTLFRCVLACCCPSFSVTFVPPVALLPFCC